jgi:hypothetical protein
MPVTNSPGADSIYTGDAMLRLILVVMMFTSCALFPAKGFGDIPKTQVTDLEQEEAGNAREAAKRKYAREVAKRGAEMRRYQASCEYQCKDAELGQERWRCVDLCEIKREVDRLVLRSHYYY